MSYIGNTPTNQNFVAGSDQFNGTGSQTVFTLSRNVNTVNDIQVVVSNVPQDPFTAYSVSGNSLTFTSAPPSGTGNIYVVYRATNVQTFVPTQGVSPSFGDLTYTGTLTGSTGVMNIGSGQVYKDTSGNVGIGTSSPDSLSNFRFVDVGSSSTNQGVIQANNGTVKTAIYVNGTNGVLATRTNHNLNFQTNATNQAAITTAGNFQFNSGYGSVATAYGCRAWVNFNGTGTVAIRASGNVSSITDNGVGVYIVNFSNAMPDVNYSATGSAGDGGTAASVLNLGSTNANAGINMAIGSCKVVTQNDGGAIQDKSVVCVSFFR